MMFLITAIIRGTILVFAGMAESKGWFTPTQFNPYLDEIVNIVVTGLLVAIPIAWHMMEMRWNGFFPGSPFPPSNLPALQIAGHSTATLNQSSIAITPPTTTQKPIP